ncbi:MAG: transglycosylase SLT domain-containing protein [Deltaproteobacteria bacterium]|nr:transglycosylase SLT domain-containing protein [Deltaproteobacteria bacterium]
MCLGTKMGRSAAVFVMALSAAAFVFYVSSFVQAQSNPFPVYASIKTNVAFWKKIYSKYPSTRGIVHDSRDLNIIYGVIKLKRADHPGARKINRARIKRAKNKYRAILLHLSKTKNPASAEARRVGALFGKHATPSVFRKAARNIRCQIGQKDRFREGIIRSGAYLEEIKRIFRTNGLPVDLAYLPHVESSFNPKAYSKFGAAGIWQFTRRTGRRFMTIDYTVDERRDPIFSSLAAAKLLKENYRKLGDWPLAITAYNHGANGMIRAKRLKGGYEAIFNRYNGYRFRFASRNFYSEFIAALEVAKNYKRYFGHLHLDRPEKTREIRLPGYVAVKDLARFLEVDILKIRRLNPALREPVYRAEKYIPRGFRLRLPARSARKLAELPADLLRQNQKRSLFYRVERGDTAGKIARMHGVSLRELIDANHLNRRATIYVGQYLRLPVSKKSGSRLASLKPAEIHEKSVVFNEKAIAENPPVTISKSASKKIPHGNAAATQQNSTLTTLPEPREKKRAVVEAPALPEPAMAIEDLEIKRVIFKGGQHIGIIKVAVEETLGHYADWLKVPAREIRRINGLRYGKKLHIHQKLKIPLYRVSKEIFEEKRIEYHKEISEDFFSAYKVETLKIYYIKKGDNFWKLCREVFEVPLWLVQNYNANVDLNDLRMSQPIRIPVLEKINSG